MNEYRNTAKQFAGVDRHRAVGGDGREPLYNRDRCFCEKKPKDALKNVAAVACMTWTLTCHDRCVSIDRVDAAVAGRYHFRPRKA